jgi:hypothetical protein
MEFVSALILLSMFTAVWKLYKNWYESLGDEVGDNE